MFLEIVTRHLTTRNEPLRRNQESLAQLTSGDWKQTLLIDKVGRGVPWASKRLAKHTPAGEFVWVLDDDDECIFPELVTGLKIIDSRYAPDAIMVRMDHGKPLGVLPAGPAWKGVLYEGGVGCSALIASAETWLRFRAHWGDRYAGDWDFVNAVINSDVNVYWYDVVASRVGRKD
jgi:hypothetical protein